MYPFLPFFTVKLTSLQTYLCMLFLFLHSAFTQIPLLSVICFQHSNGLFCYCSMHQLFWINLVITSVPILSDFSLAFDAVNSPLLRYSLCWCSLVKDPPENTCSQTPFWWHLVWEGRLNIRGAVGRLSKSMYAKKFLLQVVDLY